MKDLKAFYAELDSVNDEVTELRECAAAAYETYVMAENMLIEAVGELGKLLEEWDEYEKANA